MSPSQMELTGPPHGHEECPKVAEWLSRLGDRWTLPVVISLREGPRRFNELRRLTQGISQQMLARTLKVLERDGMTTRSVLPTVPPQVEYALTPLGQALAAEGARLGEWTRARLPEIEANRDRYDGDIA